MCGCVWLYMCFRTAPLPPLPERLLGFWGSGVAIGNTVRHFKRYSIGSFVCPKSDCLEGASRLTLTSLVRFVVGSPFCVRAVLVALPERLVGWSADWDRVHHWSSTYNLVVSRAVYVVVLGDPQGYV